VPLKVHKPDVMTEQGRTVSMGRNSVRLGVLLSLLAGAQLLSSFGIQWYTVAQLGAGADTDALYAGTTLLQIFSVVVMDPLSFVLVPLLSARPELERRRLAWPLFIGSGALFAGVTLVMYGAAPYLVSALVPGFSDATRQLTVDLTRIQLIGLVGVAWFTVLAALYQARNRFLWMAWSLLFCSLLGWGLLVMGLSQVGVRLAAWVQVFIWSGPALLLLKGLGAWSWDSVSVDAEFFRELGTRMRPLLLSAACVRTGFVIDRFLTSFLASGSLVILELIWRLLAAVVRILNQGLVTPAVPTLARLAQAGAWREFVGLCSVRLVWMAGISACALTGLLAVVIISQSIGLWMGGQAGLTAESIRTVRMTLFACAGGLLCGGVNYVLVNAFYAEGETGIPARIEAMASLGGIILKGLGFLTGGLIGIAVAISLQYALTTLLLGTALYRRMMARLRENSSRSVGPCLAVETSDRLS
jgi:putative peptidoglycan lipid II flippase